MVELNIYSDDFFMKQALLEAQKSFEIDEIPVGCVIVCNNQIIGKGHNLTERLNDVTAHAEMQAITAAANFLGAKYLNECILFVTLEPCVMCAGALYWSQIGRLVYGASDNKRGFMKEGKHLVHPKTEIVKGLMAKESEEMLKSFFKKLR